MADEDEDTIIDIEIVNDIIPRKKEEGLTQPNPKKLFDFEPDEIDEGIGIDELQTLARSNRPDIARAARDALSDIDDAAQKLNLDMSDIDQTTFPTPKIIDDIGGVEVSTPIRGSVPSVEFKQAARTALRSRSGGGGAGDPSNYGDAGYEELEYYLDEWESDDWQMLRQGYSVEEILVGKWESDNYDYDSWDDYLENRDELDDGDF